jgi:enolase-phosphatase E1
VKYVLVDVEGTTTSIDFVRDVLFPYSLDRLDALLAARASDAEVKALIKECGGVEGVKALIREDRKHPALKRLQGLIWRAGYESGELKGHVYDDVPGALARWRERGLGVGVYSSGSVLAQRLLFGHSTHGDLNVFFSHNFDASVGPKREARSYAAIAAALGLSPADVLFLSDAPEELAAAKAAGFSVRRVVRDGSSVDALSDFDSL